MRITFALRSDAKRKPGGDSTKVARYADYLSDNGVHCEVVYSIDSLRGTQPDLVHVLNLDLPLENLAYARAARRLGAKVAISTISHPFEGMIGMYRYGNDRFYRALRRAALPPEYGINVRERAKLLQRKQFASSRGPLGFRAAQRKLLETVDLALPMAAGEEAYVRARFGYRGATSVVRNGFTFSPTPEDAPTGSPEYDAITVGRIEPRKNSLEVARAARAAQVKIAFAGSVNSNHGAYVQSFLDIAQDPGSGVTFLGKLAHADLRQALLRSRTYINAAWFEVVSQADMEAAALGVPVVTTKYSYIDDSLGAATSRLDPLRFAADDASSALVSALAEARSPVFDIRQLTWGAAGADLLNAYRTILEK